MPVQEVAKIWMDGELVDWADAKIHVLTHGLHYGSGVFEGIRLYDAKNGPAVFRLSDHIRRLHKSAKICLMDVPYSPEELVEAVKATVRANELRSCYIRPLVYLGYGEMGLNPLPAPVSVLIAMWPWGSYLGDEGVEHGIKAAVSSWRRHDPNTLPPTAKATALYLNSSFAKVEALKSGYDEAIMLNPQGLVAEGSAENLFVVHDGVILTPPASAGALKGIRRDSVMTIARDLGMELHEANLTRADLYVANEVFITGTAAEVVPIRSIDEREIGEPGPITKQIQSAMKDATHGQNPKYEHWNEYVS